MEQRRKEIAPDLSEADYFERFTIEQVLKDLELSYDEVEEGIVGGGHDGGIDGLYLFVNGTLILEDTELNHFKNNLVIKLIFFQSKTSPNFREDTMNRFLSSTSDLLDMSKELDNFTSTYNENVLNKIRMFRKTYSELADRFPSLCFEYFYVTKGEQPSDNVKRKTEPLETKVKSQFSNSKVQVSFFGAGKLLEIANHHPKTTYQLTLSNNPISVGSDCSLESESSLAGSGFLAIVNLRNYYDFITDDKKKLKRHLFEANVRDYQGRVQVNKGIRETLQDEGHKEDFWWLNNGITMVSSKTTHSSGKLTIENPLIVNGIQTSTEIFEYFNKQDSKNENRSILVRVIEPVGEESRDRIIQATNSQTPIPIASLRATDKIHRNIEQHLSQYNIYYDRRKNFYKNEGKPLGQIIGIQKLAQSVMSLIMRRPHDARARPSSLLKNNDEYEYIFNDKYHIDIYRICAVILQKVEKFFKSVAAASEKTYRSNLKFHLAMVATLKISNEINPSVDKIRNIDIDKINEAFLMEHLQDVKRVFKMCGENDKVAKGSEFTQHLLNRVEETLRSRIS